jgi:biotin carboxylase
MKDCLKHTRVSLPRYEAFDPATYEKQPEAYLSHLQTQLRFPLFAKPINSAGSLGTARLNTLDALRHWADHTHQETQYEIDEFIEGTLYHIDTLCAGGQIITTQVGEYAYPMADFFKHRATGSIHLPQAHPVTQQLTELNRTILNAMDFCYQGSTHLEVFIDPTGQAVFLEIAGRTPGCWIPQLYQTRLGFDWVAAHLRIQAYNHIDLHTNEGPYEACLIFPTIDGHVSHRHAPPDVASAMTLEYHTPLGLQHAPKHVFDRLATLRLKNSNFKQLHDDFTRLKDHVFFER